MFEDYIENNIETLKILDEVIPPICRIYFFITKWKRVSCFALVTSCLKLSTVHDN